MREPLPAHERAAILDRTARPRRGARRRDRTDDLAEAGKPMKAARDRGAARASRRSRWPPSRRASSRATSCRWTRPRPASGSSRSRSASRSASSGRSRRSTSRSTSSRTRSHRRSQPAARSSSSPRRRRRSRRCSSRSSRRTRRAPAGLAQRRLRVGERDRRRARRGRARRLITFTGSAGVGWKLRERAPRKRVNLELGNATPVIVAADADLDDVAAASPRTRSRSPVRAASRCSGSTSSVGVRRVPRALPPARRGARRRRPGGRETDVGPLISQAERDRVLEWIEEARRQGAEVLTGGTLDGELLRPTVVANAPADAKVSCEEVFGPVCTVGAYDTLDEAIALANGTRYGLQAGIFTRDVKAALRARPRSSSAASRSTRRRRSAPTRCRTAASRTPGNTREGPAYAVREMTEERARRPPALVSVDGRAPSTTPSARQLRRPASRELKRERKALLQVREERLRDLGGLALEMYKRDRFNAGLVVERCAELVAIEARVQEIDALLDGTARSSAAAAARRASAARRSSSAHASARRAAAPAGGADGPPGRTPSDDDVPAVRSAVAPGRSTASSAARLPGPASRDGSAIWAGWLRRSAVGARRRDRGRRAVAASGGRRRQAAIVTAIGGFATAPDREHGEPPEARRASPNGRPARTAGRSRSPRCRRRRAAPRARSGPAPRAKASTAGRVLDSSRYASLHPGYWIVFSGVYGSEAEATSALEPRAVRTHGGVRRVVP